MALAGGALLVPKRTSSGTSWHVLSTNLVRVTTYGGFSLLELEALGVIPPVFHPQAFPTTFEVHTGGLTARRSLRIDA